MSNSFFFFLLDQFAAAIDARKDLGEYWQSVMQDQAMPETIQGLVSKDSALPLSNKQRTVDCHEKEESFVKDFEPQPSVRVYRDDTKLTAFVKDFEPKPSATVYRDDATKLTEDKSFVKDFEPRPNVSVYHVSSKEEKSFVKNFEPRPNVSVYQDDAGLKEEKSFVKDFEPRPNVSVYQE
ncbi:organ-specific protein S2-like [Cornus florida]|uniref:organ-specific protein S2-like n=1 Tax=Cornus florida TaxID=4283 RepID=UPI0028A01B3C|nr:organ-specific protein S2-like [Cornus florida]